MPTIRCDAVTVHIHATEYDDLGRPIGEMTSAPVKVFRAKVRDFWSEVDKSVAAMVKERTAQAQPPAEPPKKKGAKGK